MSKSLELTILLKSTFTKNVSEEKFKTFHQMWSWLWRLFTKCYEIKKIVSQTSCFSNQSLRTYPKKRLNLSSDMILILETYHKQNSGQFLKYYPNVIAWNRLPSVRNQILYCQDPAPAGLSIHAYLAKKVQFTPPDK